MLHWEKAAWLIGGRGGGSAAAQITWLFDKRYQCVNVGCVLNDQLVLAIVWNGDNAYSFQFHETALLRLQGEKKMIPVCVCVHLPKQAGQIKDLGQEDCAKECGWGHFLQYNIFPGPTKSREKNWKLVWLLYKSSSWEERIQQTSGPWTVSSVQCPVSSGHSYKEGLQTK